MPRQSQALSNQKSAYRENYSDFIFHTWFGFHVHSDVEFVNVSHEQEFKQEQDLIRE